MTSKEYVYELTLDEALQKLDYTLYDRNCDIRVIKARQQLIDVIRKETNKLKKDLEKKTSDDIFVVWLKSVLEVYDDKRLTQGNLRLRIKENISDQQGAIRCIKEWLEDDNSNL